MHEKSFQRASNITGSIPTEDPSLLSLSKQNYPITAKKMHKITIFRRKNCLVQLKLVISGDCYQ